MSGTYAAVIRKRVSWCVDIGKETDQFLLEVLSITDAEASFNGSNTLYRRCVQTHIVQCQDGQILVASLKASTYRGPKTTGHKVRKMLGIK